MVGLTHPLAMGLLLPALALLLWPAAARALVPVGLPGDWVRVIEPALRATADGNKAAERGQAIGLPIAIWCLLVMALAGPGIESGGRQGFGNLVGRVLVLDLGAGNDVAALRVAAGHLLDLSPDVPTAVVVATADAFDVMPLTRDRRQIDRYLQVVDPGLMPLGGRAPALAIGHAEGLLERAGIVVGQVVLVTGGAPPTDSSSDLPGESERWLRAFLVAGAVPNDQRDGWDAYAEAALARLAIAQSDVAALRPVANDLQSAAERAARAAGEHGRLDLTPWLIAAAALLWLGLFRRRLER